MNCRMQSILRKVFAKRSGEWLTNRSDRLFSCLSANCQLHREKDNVANRNVMIGKEDRFGGITVQINKQDFPAEMTEQAFNIQLRDSLNQWRAEGRIAVWLHVPIAQSRFIASASEHGFTFHHSRQDQSTLCLWLGEGESRLPGFATHQVGVAGAVLDEASGKVLVVQDKNKTKNAWKFPGGLSDPGENIGDTAAPGGVGGDWGAGRVPISAEYQAAAQAPGSVWNVRHVPDLPSEAADVPHRVLHPGVLAVRVAPPGGAGPHRRHHANHQPRRQAPPLRPAPRLPSHRPVHAAAARRLLWNVLPAVPQGAALD